MSLRDRTGVMLGFVTSTQPTGAHFCKYVVGWVERRETQHQTPKTTAWVVLDFVAEGPTYSVLTHGFSFDVYIGENGTNTLYIATFGESNLKLYVLSK